MIGDLIFGLACLLVGCILGHVWTRNENTVDQSNCIAGGDIVGGDKR